MILRAMYNTVSKNPARHIETVNLQKNYKLLKKDDFAKYLQNEVNILYEKHSSKISMKVYLYVKSKANVK
jgi:predicted Ser/Thr protein kinase